MIQKHLADLESRKLASFRLFETSPAPAAPLKMGVEHALTAGFFLLGAITIFWLPETENTQLA